METSLDEALNCLTQGNLFLEQNKVNGTILFCMVTGSRAYNLDNHTSDTDYLGVYLFDSTEFLSFDNQLPRDSLSTLPDSDEVDTTLFEAKQFAQLLDKGNPFAVEVVFSRKLSYMTKYWDELYAIRRTLLNKKTVTQFLAYCENQWSKHEKKPLVGKRIYHVVR
eukprot:TRINITY_DN3958_c0_g1_i1.p1 TRINITY_DN3958_c0_g1~~TRINITY_DN3958_c0_g1_i1.p1  ORF type:complete len:165 (+),score=22.78 TRINITY_DN3958_c0_g1_i1:1-495(+)